MRSSDALPIGILYEHPGWFEPLFAELDRRGLPYVAIHAPDHRFDPADDETPYGLVFNRMSPSAHLRGHRSTIPYTTRYLRHLERLRVPVLNGSDAWNLEVSKAAQLSLFERLEIAYPRARVLHDAGHAPAAAKGLRFPVVVKPNVGGSGAGIRRYDSPEELRRASENDTIDLGVDHTGLVQEFIPAREGRIMRVEVLDDRVLYGIRVRTSGESFNLCPADLCEEDRAADRDGRPETTPALEGACPADAAAINDRVEGFEPPEEIRAAATRIVSAGRMDLGGVEYLVDDRDGQVYFYDVNALSNFVADAPSILGFDPFVDLVDWLEDRWRAAVGTADAAAAAD